MTINYTTLLGLAKPVTGTESGEWGDVVNDQITSLVEDAIANAASISVTAGNVTLTDNNGTSDQARMAILLVTGSPGVSRNIVAPSTSKWYIVKNGSNAEVVLKGSATTGVTIPAGAEVLAFWNGSDFEVTSMVGPSTSTDNAVARFDGTTGKVVQNSAVTIADTSGDITTAGYVFTAAGAVGTPAYSTSGDTNTGMWFPAADTIAFSEGGSEVMRITSSNAVTIGPTINYQSTRLNVTGETSNSLGTAFRAENSDRESILSARNDRQVNISTKLCINIQNSLSSASISTFQDQGSASPVLYAWNNATSGDNVFVTFSTEGSPPVVRGSIDYNRAGGLTRYNTTSDYRAKDIIGPAINSGATIDELKVYEGVMKGATQRRPMLVAHEAQEHAPYAVSGIKDELNEDGSPKFQQMDVSSLVPLLIAEIQSLRARVAAIEAKGA